MSNSRLVYSTADGDRRRSAAEQRQAPPRQRPSRLDGAVLVSRETGGRRGKTVTIVSGLPPDALDAVAGELKRLCGAGGAVKDGAVEIQGDHRERIAEKLRSAGHTVKLAGG